MVSRAVISKSRYLAGLQCLKYLWFLANAREEIPQPDFVSQFIFNQGTTVGEYAKKLYPEGIDLGRIKDLKEQILKTGEALLKRKPIFEAGCRYDCVYSRADILEPSDRGSWNILEVKSSTQLKEEYINDVAFQRYCFKKAGVNIRNCYLVHINNRYIKQGDINPEELFKKVDITEETGEVLEEIDVNIQRMLEAIEKDEPPGILIGRHCYEPYTCPLKDKCWEFLPDNHVFNLYGDKRRAARLYSEGILSIEDIPDRYDLSLKQQIQLRSARTRKPVINKQEISKFISSLEYPLYFFDFETYSPAIPLYDGTGPYQRIPFQYSIHVLYSNNKEPEHFDFLAKGLEDPRKKLLESLKCHLGNRGSIIVYYEQFEKGVLKELAEAFPGYEKWVDSILSRIADLYKPFGNFHYHHLSQKGSASVKSVLPAITNLSYNGMEISDGLAASAYFLYLYGIYGSKKSPPSGEEEARIRKSLIKYCRMDTGGMIHILRALIKETGQKPRQS